MKTSITAGENHVILGPRTLKYSSISVRKRTPTEYPAKTFRIVVALLFASLLFTTAKVTTFAHKTYVGLPVLKLDYNIGLSNWNTTLDPANTALANDADTEMLMHAGLVRILPPTQTNGPSNVVLDLASKVSVSKDRKTYTFQIRKNAKFSNGHPVTAQDVIFSITRAANKSVDPQEADTYDNLIQGLHAYSVGKVKNIGGLRAIGTKTVQVKINQPAAYFFASFAYSSNYVLDRTVMAGHKVGDMTTNCKLNVGAGPFAPVCQSGSSDVTSFYPGGSTPTLTLKPNKYYYGHKAKLILKVPVIASPETAYNSYKFGNMDTAAITPVSEIPKWRGRKDFLNWGTSVVRYIQTNVTTAPFNNIHCRLAVAHAIDRTTISQRVVPGVFTNLYTVVPPGFLGFYNGKATANKQGGIPYYSQALAKKELGRCPGGVNVEWPYFVTTTDGRRIRDAISSMLDAVGIKAHFRDLTSQENSRYAYHPMSQTGAKILRSAWQQDYPDPRDYITLLLRHGQTYAITGWNNSAFNQAVDEADVSANSKARAALYITAQKVAISQAVWIPEWNDIGTALVKPYVHGIVAGAAYTDVMPSGGDWSRVSISKH